MKEKRNLHSPDDLSKLLDDVQRVGYPCHVIIWSGADSSIAQHRLEHKWLREVASQLHEFTKEQYHSLCKLWFGIPIMLEDDDFAERWETYDSKFSYEEKLAMMDWFPVTSLMTAKQKSRYLDMIFQHFVGKGCDLTVPDDKRFGPPTPPPGEMEQ